MDLIKLKQLITNNKCILGLLILFALVYTFNLDKYPHLWIDEVYFSNPAYNLAFHGFLGTTMMPTFYNIANYTYWQMPFYMILLATSFKLFGFGIIQARIVSVIFGFFTVLFTYLFAKELYSQKIGLIAATFLIFNPLFFIVVRQARMDIVIVCFILIALYFIINGLKNNRGIYYFGSGIFAGLSVLTHPNAVMGIISIVLIYCMYKIDFKTFKVNFKLKEIIYWILGPVLLVIPYLYYISLDFHNFLNQFNTNIISSASTPLNNIFTEKIRYISTISIILDVDTVFTLIVILILAYFTLLGLLYVLKNRTEISGKILIMILGVHLVLLTVLVSQKDAPEYLGLVLPYLSILMSLPFKFKITYNKLIKPIVIVLFSAFIFLNALGFINVFNINSYYNYQDVNSAVEYYIPNGSVVVGYTDYWVTLHNNYTFYSYLTLTIADFKRLKVKYIMYDQYLTIHSRPKVDKEIRQFLDTDFSGLHSYLKRNCTLVGEIPHNTNITYSPIKIYKINY